MNDKILTVADFLESTTFCTSPAKAVKLGFVSDPDGTAELYSETELFLCISGFSKAMDLRDVFSKKLLDATVSGWSIISEDMIVIHVIDEFN